MKKILKNLRINRQSAKATLGAMTVAGATVATNASAALTLDSASILTDIATCVAFITAVGLAVLGMIYVAKALKWARKAG